METKTNQEKVLDIFFDDPLEKFHLREIARLTNLNPNTVINMTNQLIKEDLIKKEKKTHLVEFQANINEKFRELKIIKNLEKIYRSGIIKYLNEHFKNPRVIILFGSFRKGEDIKESDIDIAIESYDVKEYQVIELKKPLKFEKQLGRNIQIHLFNKKNVDINVFNSIANGIILTGFLEVKK